MHALTWPGRLILALTVAALGAENVFVARSGVEVVPVLPWVPAHHPFWASLMGLTLLLLGLAMLTRTRAWAAAVSLGTLLLAWVLVRQLYGLVQHPMDVGVRTGVFESLAIAGAALTLAGTLPATSHMLDKLTAAGRFVFAGSMVVFGIDHFAVFDLIVSLVPSWIPGGGRFWAVLTGVGMIVAGLSISTKVLARWAGIALAAMFGLWFLLLHLPRVVQPPRTYDPDEWSSAFIALAMCGGALIMAGALSKGAPATKAASATA